MKDSKDVVILRKIIKYCNDSRKYAINKTYDEFVSDELSLVFSVFSLSQAGELVTVLSDDVISEYDKIPWSALKSIRNRIVHNYEGVKYNIIWNIIQNEIQPLIYEFQKIIIEVENK
jgi:uncharacterized protein with HEPN domain